MRKSVALVAGLLFGAASLQGQQPAPQPTLVPPSPITVYRIDLLPSGTGFAMDEPVLEGDVYVFHSLPERTISRLPKAKVKAITRRSMDLSKEVVWQTEMNPTGRMLSFEEPVKKGAGLRHQGLQTGASHQRERSRREEDHPPRGDRGVPGPEGRARRGRAVRRASSLCRQRRDRGWGARSRCRACGRSWRRPGDRQLGPARDAWGDGRLRAAERCSVTPGRRAEGRAAAAPEVSLRRRPTDRPAGPRRRRPSERGVLRRG